ncbi:hypothetical protein BDC45DRAFT_608661 [Circinella umbellata]|nr:hypothetical protein BDC45DRAFT_608661 [Circinella umbellata]
MKIKASSRADVTQHIPGSNNSIVDYESRRTFAKDSSDTSSDSISLGSSRHRPFRRSNHPSTTSLCLLETGSCSNSNRHLHSDLVDVQASIHSLTIEFNQPLSSHTHSRADSPCNNNSPLLAERTMVSSTSVNRTPAACSIQPIGNHRALHSNNTMAIQQP